MDFTISGLSPEPYRDLFGLSDEELAAHGARRYVATSCPGFPDRIEMRDAEVGETLLLVNHVSVYQDTPYRASHAIFVREGAQSAYQERNEVPEVMMRRLISLRAFDGQGMMVDAELAKGDDIKPAIVRLLSQPSVSRIDAHYALRGCYSGKIERA
ncbi:MAG: DUF1203 domain-containing protein [Pseudomonadota bacterium]